MTWSRLQRPARLPSRVRRTRSRLQPARLPCPKPEKSASTVPLSQLVCGRLYCDSASQQGPAGSERTFGPDSRPFDAKGERLWPSGNSLTLCSASSAIRFEQSWLGALNRQSSAGPAELSPVSLEKSLQELRRFATLICAPLAQRTRNILRDVPRCSLGNVETDDAYRIIVLPLQQVVDDAFDVVHDAGLSLASCRDRGRRQFLCRIDAAVSAYGDESHSAIQEVVCRFQSAVAAGGGDLPYSLVLPGLTLHNEHSCFPATHSSPRPQDECPEPLLTSVQYCTQEPGSAR